MSRDHADKAKRLEGARRSQQPCEVWDSVGLHEECIMPHRPGSRAESSVSISVSSALMPMAMMKRLVVVVSAAAAVSQAGASRLKGPVLLQSLGANCVSGLPAGSLSVGI